MRRRREGQRGEREINKNRDEVTGKGGGGGGDLNIDEAGCSMSHYTRTQSFST